MTTSSVALVLQFMYHVIKLINARVLNIREAPLQEAEHASGGVGGRGAGFGDDRGGRSCATVYYPRVKMCYYGDSLVVNASAATIGRLYNQSLSPTEARANIIRRLQQLFSMISQFDVGLNESVSVLLSSSLSSSLHVCSSSINPYTRFWLYRVFLTGVGLDIHAGTYTGRGRKRDPSVTVDIFTCKYVHMRIFIPIQYVLCI